MLKPLTREEQIISTEAFRLASRDLSALRPLTPADRKAARDAFNEVMNTHDEDPLAIAATVTAKALLLAKRNAKEEQKRKRCKEGNHGR